MGWGLGVGGPREVARRCWKEVGRNGENQEVIRGAERSRDQLGDAGSLDVESGRSWEEVGGRYLLVLRRSGRTGRNERSRG